MMWKFNTLRDMYLIKTSLPLLKCGYYTIGLRLLSQSAKNNGVKCLYDNIDINNKSAIRLFKNNGFVEVEKNDNCIILKKEL